MSKAKSTPKQRTDNRKQPARPQPSYGKGGPVMSRRPPRQPGR